MAKVLFPPIQATDLLHETSVFHDCWWRHLAPKFQITHTTGDFLVHRKPVLKGLLHLHELRLAGWNNAWVQDLTGTRAETLNTLLHQCRWDYFRMTWCKDRLALQAFPALVDMGLHPIHLPAMPQYVVNLNQGWDHYLALQSRNRRRHITRLKRQAASLQPMLHSFEGPTGIQSFFDIFFPHHIAYWKQKAGTSYFEDPHERQFIQAWAQALVQSGQLFLNALYLAGVPANLNMSLVHAGVQYQLLTINTGRHLALSPGLLGLYMRLEKAAQEGIQMVNLGAGDTRFKQQAATHTLPCGELLVPNPKSTRGVLYCTGLKWHLTRQSTP